MGRGEYKIGWVLKEAITVGIAQFNGKKQKQCMNVVFYSQTIPLHLCQKNQNQNQFYKPSIPTHTRYFDYIYLYHIKQLYGML